jgi:hypothetical protein
MMTDRTHVAKQRHATLQFWRMLDRHRGHARSALNGGGAGTTSIPNAIAA